ncbi:Inner membrane protein YihY, formerly thought to be RNase BN [Labilithrix luteola]|uniref:Inner membrane protein YihY, formerly thought to be RNase BN n=1 Tax=Labilithrix luteola TaxID=1391654 RepID=A0A0K1PLL1_9BACT|nr:YihY/virulence factor BrkB family protein [Labilithrix luteola]AKU94004.1 Inner membrane protein YihY, formerly thought to be RNase BN [Labilithrix luteola]
MIERLRLRARGLFRVLVATAERWTELEGFRRGAAFAYYATFSIFPLLLLTVTVIGFVIGSDEPARIRLLDALADEGTPVRAVLDQTLSAMQQSHSVRGTSAVIGAGALLFSASGAMVELDVTLNFIWGFPPRRGHGVVGTARALVEERLSAFALVGGIGLTMLVSLFMSSVLGVLAQQAPVMATPAILRTMEQAVSLALISGVLACAFHFLPRSRPPFAEVIGGAVLTTTILTIVKTLFALYFARLPGYSAYGVAGGVLALAFWIYVSSQIIFMGATLTSVLCLNPGLLDITPPEAKEKATETETTSDRAQQPRREG